MSSRRRRAFRSVALPVALLACLVGVAPTLADGPTTSRVSVSSTEAQASDFSSWPSISADGRFVAFVSVASDLVPNDTNGTWDIFVRDRQQGTTWRVSKSSAEGQANGSSTAPSISADGRYITFESYASDLVANDTNGVVDVFVRDRQQGTTRRVSIDSAGGQANSGSSAPSISADGRYVAFESVASDLVPNDTNFTYDVFVRDRQQGTTRRVSISSAEGQGHSESFGPSISADGRYVAFGSSASDLVPNDTNGTTDIFVRDRQHGITWRVSKSSADGQANSFSYDPSISADGRYVAFESWATDLVPNDTNRDTDVFVRDRQQGTTRRVSIDSAEGQVNSDSNYPSISADGRYVAFYSGAADLVANDTNGTADIFVRDRQQGITRRVSIDSAGGQANSDSAFPSISADGRYVAFTSWASDLVPNDTNGYSDVFVRGPLQ